MLLGVSLPVVTLLLGVSAPVVVFDVAGLVSVEVDTFVAGGAGGLQPVNAVSGATTSTSAIIWDRKGVGILSIWVDLRIEGGTLLGGMLNEVERY